MKNLSNKEKTRELKICFNFNEIQEVRKDLEHNLARQEVKYQRIKGEYFELFSLFKGMYEHNTQFSNRLFTSEKKEI